MLLWGVAFLSAFVAGQQQQQVTLPSQCSCGFRDPSTTEIFTESIIIYFNETTSVDSHVFELLNYRNKNQQGWNTIFPQGSNPANFEIGNNATWQWQDDLNQTSPSLQMLLDRPPQFNHISTGAEMRSMRRDMLYGSFRAEMRSAAPWVGGSAMSMYMHYNDSQEVGMDLTNMNDARLARVLQLVNGEWPDYALAINYSQIERGYPPRTPPRSPWDFMDLRFDWTKDNVDFWLNGNNSRHVDENDRSLPETPGSLYFSHWSTGDRNYMQGPPTNGSFASIKWIRAFFNSSQMTDAQHRAYDQQCLTTQPCSTEDITLRGSTEYQRASTVPFRQRNPIRGLRRAAGYVAAAFAFFGIAAIINALIRRGPWHKVKKMNIPGTKRASTQKLRQSVRDSFGMHLASQYLRPESQQPYHALTSATASGFETPAPGYESRAPEIVSPYPFVQQAPMSQHSGAQTPLPAYETRRHSPWQSMYTSVAPKREGSVHGSSVQGHARSASEGTSRPLTSYSANREAKVYLSPSQETPPELFVIASPDEESDGESDVGSARAQAYMNLAGGSQSSEDQEEIRRLSHQRSGSHTRPSDLYNAPPRGSLDDSASPRDDKHHSFMDLDDEDVPPIPRTSSQKSRRQESSRKMSIDLPSNPQDISAGKAIREKTGVPDGMTGGAAVAPVYDQLPQAPKVVPTAAPKQRIDYLAGLIAISCIMVTARHFALTFWPFVVEAQGNTQHFA